MIMWLLFLLFLSTMKHVGAHELRGSSSASASLEKIQNETAVTIKGEKSRYERTSREDGDEEEDDDDDDDDDDDENHHSRSNLRGEQQKKTLKLGRQQTQPDVTIQEPESFIKKDHHESPKLGSQQQQQRQQERQLQGTTGQHLTLAELFVLQNSGQQQQQEGNNGDDRVSIGSSNVFVGGNEETCYRMRPGSPCIMRPGSEVIDMSNIRGSNENNNQGEMTGGAGGGDMPSAAPASPVLGGAPTSETSSPSVAPTSEETNQPECFRMRPDGPCSPRPEVNPGLTSIFITPAPIVMVDTNAPTSSPLFIDNDEQSPMPTPLRLAGKAESDTIMPSIAPSFPSVGPSPSPSVAATAAIAGGDQTMRPSAAPIMIDTPTPTLPDMIDTSTPSTTPSSEPVPTQNPNFFLQPTALPQGQDNDAAAAALSSSSGSPTPSKGPTPNNPFSGINNALASSFMLPSVMPSVVPSQTPSTLYPTKIAFFGQEQPVPPSPGYPVCQICGGDGGLFVTNPEVVISLPGVRDEPISCKDLELSGLLGFIEESECLQLPPLLGPCACQSTR